MAETLVWTCVGLLALTYVGYPAVMAWVGRRRMSPPTGGADSDHPLPSVSVVIAARNEEQVIARKVSSCLASRYPSELLDVVVVSDGSDDATAERARAVGSERVRVIELPSSGGKAAALNCAMAAVTAPVVVLTDARQRLDEDAVARLVDRLADPEVGAVSGDLRYDQRDERGLRGALHRYWSYERSIRIGESHLHSCVGATGALYAIRSGLWQALPEATLLDDVHTPMRIVLAGYRVVFEPRAWAWDEASAADDREYWRRVRTLTGNYQLLLDLPAILRPDRNPIWVQFALHKLGRLVSPLLLLVLLASSALADGTLYRFLFWAQVSFWMLAALVFATRSHLRFARPVALPYAFALTQSAALVAFFNFVRRDWNVWGR